MYKKLSIILATLFVAATGFGFARESGNFLNDSFWYEGISSGEIYSGLYQNTAYTDTWTGYIESLCPITDMDIVEITEFPENLTQNTIYILSTGSISVTKTINIGDCTAIISKSGTLIDNTNLSTDIFVITGRYAILDNIQISGEKKGTQYGIKINNTNDITLNNINIQGLNGGIFSNHSNYSKYNNITISGIYALSFNLSSSNYNHISNTRCAYGIDEAGLQLDGSSNNFLENIELKGNGFQGLLIIYGNHNTIQNISAYDNKYQGILIVAGTQNILENINAFKNEHDGLYFESATGNTVKNANIYNNNTQGLTIYHGSNNTIENANIYNNVYGIIINQGNNNTIKFSYIYNNSNFGVKILSGNENSFYSGMTFNNKTHGVLFEAGNHNEFIDFYSFSNGNPGSGYCGVMIYRGSTNNLLKNTSFYNNTFGICFDGKNDKTVSDNVFENVNIINNGMLEWKAGSVTNNLYSGTLNVYGNLNSNNITVLSGTEGAEIISSLDMPFSHIINPKNSEGKYLYSRTSGYINTQGYQESFNDSGMISEYSIGLQLAGKSGYILSNGTYAIAYGDIDKFDIKGTQYIGANTRHTINIEPNEIIATTVNDGEHADIIFDTTAPTCEVEYSTTGKTHGDVIATLTGCSEEITGAELSYTFKKNDTHTFTFYDTIGNEGTILAEVTRISKSTGGGGSAGSSSKVSDQTGAQDQTNENTGKANFSFDRTAFNPTISDELNMGYQRAFANGITTVKTIEEAELDQPLNRIAMAKMLAYYAINILGKKPDTSKTISFYDVTPQMDKEFNNGVTLAYQLGIMGQNLSDNNFRPNDLVSRAEFATALSRLLYGTKDGNELYYVPHIEKLHSEGIIANINPNLQELRGYVMLMLIRNSMGIKVSGTIDDTTNTQEIPQDTQKVINHFRESFKKGESYKTIGDLQDLLRYFGYYYNGTNYTYDTATINAVHRFQVAMGILDADDTTNPARGFMGPETRAALNIKWTEFQQQK